MFTQISLMGRVTADLEIQTSTNGTDYIQFNVAVNKGFGEQEHPNFYQCVLFGKATERISKAGVKKGSLLFITGDLDLVEFTRKADGSKGMIPKITVYEEDMIDEHFRFSAAGEIDKPSCWQPICRNRSGRGLHSGKCGLVCYLAALDCLLYAARLGPAQCPIRLC